MADGKLLSLEAQLMVLLEWVVDEWNTLITKYQQLANDPANHALKLAIRGRRKVNKALVSQHKQERIVAKPASLG